LLSEVGGSPLRRSHRGEERGQQPNGQPVAVKTQVLLCLIETPTVMDRLTDAQVSAIRGAALSAPAPQAGSGSPPTIDGEAVGLILVSRARPTMDARHGLRAGLCSARRRLGAFFEFASRAEWYRVRGRVTGRAAAGVWLGAGLLGLCALSASQASIKQRENVVAHPIAPSRPRKAPGFGGRRCLLNSGSIRPGSIGRHYPSVTPRLQPSRRLVR
jgi:hypothetical protein